SDAPPFRLDLDLQAVGLDYHMEPWISWVLPFLASGAKDDGSGRNQLDLSGSFDLKLALSGKGFDLDHLMKHLSGNGDLRLADGKFQASPFFQKLASIVQVPLETVLFKEMGSDFRIDAGSIVSDALFFKGDSKLRELGFAGRTGFDRSMSYSVKLSALRDAIGDKKIKRVLDVASKVLKKDSLPLQLAGSLDAPSLAVDWDSFQLPGLDQFTDGSLADLDAGLRKLLGKNAGKVEDLLGDVTSGKVEDAAEGLLKGVGDLLGGKKKPAKKGENDKKPVETKEKVKDAVEEAVGGLLDDIFGGKKKKK
ncbi:MAG: AsmA-like C-terminal region-containing protein, partial [Planctomycetota bacterium]